MLLPQTTTLSQEAIYISSSFAIKYSCSVAVVHMGKFKGINTIRPKTTNSFRVGVSVPPLWKVRAIAKFKKIKAESRQSNGNSETDGRDITSTDTGSVARNFIDPGFPQSPNKPNFPIAQVRDELERLDKNSLIIKNEIKMLNTIRSSLMWLLNKATVLETQRNHDFTRFDESK